MNVKEKIWQSGFVRVFRFKSYLLKKLRGHLLWISILTAGICLVDQQGWFRVDTNFALPGLLGAVLGILLVFRNNTAYERWWEARKLLGQLVNTARAFALQVGQLVPDRPTQAHLIRQIALFGHVLQAHLRDERVQQFGTLASEEEAAKLRQWAHQPNGVAANIAHLLSQQRKSGALSDVLYAEMSQFLTSMVEVVGACERIRSTPMPLSFNYILKVYVYLYTLVMPFGLVGSLGWWSIPAVCAVFFLAMSMVILAEELEDPFGYHPDDLPMERIMGNIERQIQEIWVMME
jgi:putative membrane protein